MTGLLVEMGRYMQQEDKSAEPSGVEIEVTSPYYNGWRPSVLILGYHVLPQGIFNYNQALCLVPDNTGHGDELLT